MAIGTDLTKYSNYIDKDKDEVPYEDVREDKKSTFYCFLSDFDNSIEHKTVIEQHYHDYIEIIYVVSGSVDVCINKKDFIAKSGDVLVAIPGDVHSFTRKKGTKYVCIQADTNFLFSGILSNSDLHFIMPYTLYCHPEARLFTADVVDKTDIPRLIENIMIENKEKRNFYMLSIRASLSNIALIIFRSWSKLKLDFTNQDDTDRKKGLPRLTPILEIIDRQYMTDLTAESMAEVAGMSYSYFSRFFKSTLHQTFSSYLNTVRIREAENLILKDDLSIAEIAERVGYTNTSYFIQQFKRYLHVTPKKYRMKFRDTK